MIKLKKLIGESRLGTSTGEAPKDGHHGNTTKFSTDAKRHFLEIVSTYNKYQEMMDRKSDIVQVAETLGGIIEAAKQLAVNEGDDWFDKHTVKRNMNELSKLGSQFDKVTKEAKLLDQRMSGLYEDMGYILSRYYKIGEITEDEMKDRLGIDTEPVNESSFKSPSYSEQEDWSRKKSKVWDSIVNKQNLVQDLKQELKYAKAKGDKFKIKDRTTRIKRLESDIKTQLANFSKIDESINEEIYWVNSNNKVELGKFYDEVKSFMPDHSIQKLSPLSIQFDISKNDLKDVQKLAKSYNGLKVVKESIKENFSPKDISMIKKVVDKEKRLIGLSPIFKKMGWHTDFVMMDGAPPHLKLKKKKNDKQTYLLVNKKYVDKPDWVSGEIAGGLDESKQSDCDTCGKN